MTAPKDYELINHSLPEIARQASHERRLADIYANFAQVQVTSADFIIDLYRIGTKPGDAKLVEADFVQRVFIPLEMAQGLADAILTSLKITREAAGNE
jgi:hypothetical protein